ncbi:hypothetical protein ANN_04704 [Periplaneta americana]|uniref:Uncharacterized protein n=1 Tax=Periplaneta americana TaxID=6978 RepID=A0ABQ8T955_PERAM|nr:hypothetical protein ANN_04704 [Periplaneta americana]
MDLKVGYDDRDWINLAQDRTAGGLMTGRRRMAGGLSLHIEKGSLSFRSAGGVEKTRSFAVRTEDVEQNGHIFFFFFFFFFFFLPNCAAIAEMGKGLATSSLCDAIVCIWVTLPLPFIRWGCGSAVQHCGWRLFEPRFKSMILYPVFLHYIHEARPVPAVFWLRFIMHNEARRSGVQLEKWVTVLPSIRSMRNPNHAKKNSLELLNIQLASLAGDCRVGCGITRCRIQLAAVQSRFRCPRLIARQWLAAEFTKPGIAQLSA